MNLRRWLISIIVACIGFLISFILSFQVNNLDTSLKRGFLSLVVSFGVYELVRFAVIYSFGDLIAKRIEDDNKDDGKEENVDNPEHLEAEMENGEKPDSNQEFDHSVSDSVKIQRDSTPLQGQENYADVARFVKSELNMSESENM